MTTDLTMLTDGELADLWAEVRDEQRRRETLATAVQQVERLAADYSRAIKRVDGTLWDDSPVTGAHDVWPPSIVCQHPAGEYWRAGRLESHPPGTIGAPWTRVWPDGDNWTTVPPADKPLAWAVGLSAVAGTTKVTHAGRVWLAKTTHITHAGWPPSPAAWAVWDDLGPA